MESPPPVSTSLPEEPQATTSGTSQTAAHEGLSVELTAAPLRKRTLAYCVDWGILGALSYLLIFLGMFLFSVLVAGLVGLVATSPGNEIPAQLVLLLLVPLFLLAYLSFVHGYFIYHHVKRGATPGKRLFGLKVISLDGKPLSRSQCILRECLVYFDLGFVFPGLISILATQRKQRLGDLAAGTMVVHSAQTEQQDNYLYITQEEYLMLQDVLTLEPISSDLAEEFLKFAYPYFITRKTTPAAYELESWETRARSYVTNADDHHLDQRSLLLFLAEYCFQTKRS